jgi:hypothetical protein
MDASNVSAYLVVRLLLTSWYWITGVGSAIMVRDAP